MITAVGGNGGYAGGKQFVSADELREKLSHLRREKALIIKLVSTIRLLTLGLCLKKSGWYHELMKIGIRFQIYSLLAIYLEIVDLLYVMVSTT